MFNLIVKDILIQKKQLLFSFIYIFIIIVSFQSVGASMFPAGIVAFTYILVLGACAYDDKNKADVMLNSLPIKRSTIVLARYISAFVFLAIGPIAYVILTEIIKVSGIPVKVYPLTLEGLAGAFFAVSLINGLYFPIFFKIGYMKARLINFIFFFGFFFGFPFLANMFYSNKDSTWMQKLVKFLEIQGDVPFAILVIFAMFILMSLSYVLSVKFYKNREF